MGAWDHGRGMPWLAVMVGLALGLRAPAQPAGSPAAQAQPSRTNAFIVYGTVRGPDGDPMAGVTVRVYCGIGSLFCTGRTASDQDGHYRLAFGPGVLMGRLLKPGDLGVGLQAATIFAQKPGYFSRDLGRAGNLAITDTTNAPQPGFQGILHPFEPRLLDFVLEPAASIRGTLELPQGQTSLGLGMSITGKQLPPSSSVLASAKLEPGGAFEFNDVPVGYHWQIEASWRESGQEKTARSKDFLLERSKPYQMELKLHEGVLDMKLE